MQHITLNTGNIATCGDRLFELDALEIGSLPEPHDRYSILSIFGESQWCYFDLALDGQHVTANLACRVHQEDGWSNMIRFYLQIYNKLPPVSEPPNAPYLLTVVLPNPTIFSSGLAAQIEQAIAIAAID
jgi:hypothetical protein